MGDGSAFLLFLAAIMGAAWLGGTSMGLFATVLSAAAGWYIFIPNHDAFRAEAISPRTEFLLFLVEGVVTSVLAGQLSKARNAAVAGQAEARALQEELLRVSDDERRRIGHDLHDGLGQQLTGVALLSKVLGKRLAERQMPEESAQAEQISTLAAEMVGQAKHLARGLDPVPVQPDGLIQALTELCESASRIFSVDCEFVTDIASFSCEPRIATHLFRIAQEGVSNAIKHGGATTIRVQLQQEAAGNVLSVRSDGKPFRPAHDGLGMGLRIMRHRSQIIGATLDIGPATDNQTLLVCRLGNKYNRD
jgi:signal transduction histidine kinase